MIKNLVILIGKARINKKVMIERTWLNGNFLNKEKDECWFLNIGGKEEVDKIMKNG